jgi:hypothetical protein
MGNFVRWSAGSVVHAVHENQHSVAAQALAALSSCLVITLFHWQACISWCRAFLEANGHVSLALSMAAYECTGN